MGCELCGFVDHVFVVHRTFRQYLSVVATVRYFPPICHAENTMGLSPRKCLARVALSTIQSFRFYIVPRNGVLFLKKKINKFVVSVSVSVVIIFISQNQQKTIINQL